MDAETSAYSNNMTLQQYKDSGLYTLNGYIITYMYVVPSMAED